MFHLYLDGAGHQQPKPPAGKGDTDFFTMAGVLVTDEQRRALEAELDRLVHAYFPDRDPRSVKIHLSPLCAGGRVWGEIPGPMRAGFVSGMRDIIHAVRPLLFCHVLDKRGYHRHFSYLKFKPVEPPAENALRFLLTRVDKAVSRTPSRVSVTLDRDSREMQSAFSNLIESIREKGDKITGTTWRPAHTTHLERFHKPQYVDAQASRCLQVADYVSHFAFRAAEHGQANRLRELDILWDRFSGRREPVVAFAPQEVVSRFHSPLGQKEGRAGQEMAARSTET